MMDEPLGESVGVHVLFVLSLSLLYIFYISNSFELFKYTILFHLAFFLLLKRHQSDGVMD